MRGIRIYVVITLLAVFIIGGGIVIAKQSGGGGARLTVDVSVSGDRMTPAPVTARQGDTITLNITADRAGEIHLHGYDIHFAGSAGDVRTHTFKADKSGTWELEYEAGAKHLGNLVVSP